MLDLESQTGGALPLEEWEGLVHYISNEAYHEDKNYLSSSDVKLALQNLKVFKVYVIDGLKKKTTDRLSLGTLAHDVMLEGGLTRYTVMPDFKPTKSLTKKAQVESFIKKNKHKAIITEAHYETLKGMHEAFNSNPIVRSLMEHKGSIIEQAYRYMDDKTGMKCKFKPDIIIPTDGIIVDYKTCEDASEYAFRKAIARYYYHLSAVHYMIGANRIYGTKFTQFIFIAQEKEPPYSIGIWRLSKDCIRRAVKQRRELLVRIREAIANNYFPDYSSVGVKDITPPDYAYELTGGDDADEGIQDSKEQSGEA